MRSIFDKETRDGLIERIGKINETDQAKWVERTCTEGSSIKPIGMAGFWAKGNTPINRRSWVNFSEGEC